MMFGKRPKNRRLDRASVLEVRARSRSVRRSRWRSVGLALALVLGATASIYCGARFWRWLRREVITDNQLFALRTVEVVADGHWLNPEQVRQWAGVRQGDNLLTIDLARLKRDLELVPQIESASVERVLPGLLRLQVKEREPVAQVQALQSAADGGLFPAVYYLDAAGVVMPPLPADPGAPGWDQPLATLPVIRGVGPGQLRLGRALDSPGVRAALQLIAEFERSPLAATTDLQHIDVSVPEVLEVRTSQGARITLALDHLARQVGRWHLIHEAGVRTAKGVVALDLSITNNCPVLWSEAASLPVPRAKPLKPPKNRKQHV